MVETCEILRKNKITGGKNNMKKRFLSIVLAVLMLVSVLPISALAADVEPPIAETGVSTKTSENTTGPKLEKSAQWVDEKAGIAKITIKVTGEQPTQSTKKTDIVLVIDRSLSMTRDDYRNRRDWLDNAKKAAKAFATKVLNGDPNVRIAVVAYAAKTMNDWDFSSKLETVEQRIDAINTDNGNWHGTNIQAGIHSARERLKKSDKDADKFMIVLADGAPNYRFTYKDWGIGTKFDLTDAQKRTYHINNWFSWLFYATSDAFNYNEVKNTEQYAYTAAASEAYAAKATDGITCYAIGYGIPQGNNEINALMYSIASTDAGFVNAGTDENAITKVFSDIATDIQYKAHNVTLTDTMGAGFTYLSNETYPSNPAVTPSAGNKTVTWDVADKLGDETKTLTFYVQYDKNTLTDAATLPTNKSASLSYEDNKGNAQTPITVDSPAIENLARTVTYVDENNTAYTDDEHKAARYWKGTEVTQAAAPTRDGYTFKGWEKTEGDVTVDANGKFTIGSDNVTFKATWTKNTKTLTITKTWEGTTETPTVTFQLLQARKGEENTTVYQTFELDGIVDTGANGVEKEAWKATIEVPVKDDDGTEFKYSVKETKIGGTSIGAGAFNVTGTNPDKTSYIIGTWSVNSSANYQSNTYSFTNKYTPKPQYTLTYEFVGEDKPEGANAPAAESLYENQQTHLAEVNVPDGWSFDGWYTDAGCTGDKADDPYTMPGSNMTLYGKWEQKQPGVSVEKTATYTRGDADPVTLRNNTNDLNKIGRVQVGDVINYTVTIENTGDITFGYNVSDYRAIDTFSNATGDLIQIDENGKEIRKVESGKVPPNISLGGMNPGDIKTLYYRYEVLSGDVGNQINNSATAEIKSGTGAGKIQKSSNVRVLVEAPKPKTATLSFEFKSGMEGKDLPAGMPTEPKDVTEEVGKEVQLTNYTETVNDEENIGKWTFEADKPEITEAGYTVEYYRQDADGNYSNKPYYTRTTTDAGVPLKGNVGDTVKIEELEPFYKEHYKGYEFDAENANNIPQCTLQADASKNVLKIYYKALPKLEVKKEVDKQYNVKHGDTLTYTITVKNAGARNLTNVKVTDVIDAADPSKLEILPGDGYTYHEESGKIEIGNMVPRAEVVIKATYVVQEADSGNTIKNTATGSADEVEGVQATVSAYPNKIEEFKGDLVISKTYRSDTSTSPAATFYFDVYYMDGDEQISLLDEYAEISFDKNEAKKGEPATKTVEVKLNDVNEKVLESGFYVREVLEDKVDKVVYDRNAVHGFLVPFPLISAYADTDREPITVDREAYVVSTQVYENAGAFWAAWVTDELDENYNVFSFTNTYKTVRNEPVKVARSSTATTMSPTSWATPTEPFSPRARSPEPKPAQSSSVC